MSTQLFSLELEAWLRSNKPKTIGGLVNEFKEKGFAILILLLMFLPALPIPTGGITHIFGIIALLLGLEMAAGRHTIWLPKWALKKSLKKLTESKAIAFINRRIKWFEKFSRPRWARLGDNPIYRSALGIVIVVLTLGSLIAPPFTGLDTLPALGVVIICLSILFKDVVLMLIGVIVGAFGIGLEIALGGAILHNLIHFKLLF